MIDARRPQPQHPCRQQRREPHRAGRADDEFGEVPALDEIENLQHGWEAKLLQLILRQLELADGLEIDERYPRERAALAAGDDGQRVAIFRRRRRHPANRRRHAVHVFQRIGEPRALRIAQRGSGLADERLAKLAEPRAVGGHLPER